MHTFKFVQGGSTLLDLNSTSIAPVLWKPAWTLHEAYCEDDLELNLYGTSADNLNDLFISLAQVLDFAADNFARYQSNYEYTPIFLQYQHTAGTHLVQSEVFGGTPEPPADYLASDIVALLLRVKAKLFRRSYFEETSLVPLYTNATYAEGGKIKLPQGFPTTIRGDLPAPLVITAYPNTAAHDTLIACLKCDGVGIGGSGLTAQFVPKYEAESCTLGSGVLSQADTDFSNGNRARWTPTVDNTDQMLIQSAGFSNPVNNQGRFRLKVRCRDNAAAPNVKIHARAGIAVGSAYQYGPWGDDAKFVTTVGGTTTIAWVDCGVLAFPPVDFLSGTPATPFFEVWGLAVDHTLGTFDLDCVSVLPTREGGFGSGYQHIQFPTNLATDGSIQGVLNSDDRLPEGYLVDGSGNKLLGAQGVRGQPLYVWPYPSNEQVLMLYGLNAAAQTEKQAETWNITVSCRPRYLVARGS